MLRLDLTHQLKIQHLTQFLIRVSTIISSLPFLSQWLRLMVTWQPLRAHACCAWCDPVQISILFTGDRNHWPEHVSVSHVPVGHVSIGHSRRWATRERSHWKHAFRGESWFKLGCAFSAELEHMSACITIKKLWVRIPPGAWLFSLLFLSPALISQQSVLTRVPLVTLLIFQSNDDQVCSWGWIWLNAPRTSEKDFWTS